MLENQKNKSPLFSQNHKGKITDIKLWSKQPISNHWPHLYWCSDKLMSLYRNYAPAAMATLAAGTQASANDAIVQAGNLNLIAVPAPHVASYTHLFPEITQDFL